MSEEEKLLNALRKLDPVKENKESQPKAAAESIVPPPQRSDPADPNKAASTAASNATANKFRQQGAGAIGTQTGGNIAQNRYAQTAAAANPDLNRNVVNDSRWENVNQRSYEDTLNLARLADAFNAQRTWFSPDVNPLSRGGEGGGIRTNMVQNSQLNTQEQKAMDIARAGAQQRLLQDVARQGRSQDLPLTIEEAVAKGIIDKGTQKDLLDLGFSQQMMNDIWSRMYNDEYSNDIRERYAQYTADLMQHETNQNAERLYLMFQRDPTLAVITAQQYGTQMPSFETWLENSNISKVLRDSGFEPGSPESLGLYNLTNMNLILDKTRANAATALSSIPAATGGVRFSILNNDIVR